MSLRTVVRRLGSIALVLTTAATPTSGQTRDIHPEIAELRSYAPLLWLANGEPFYPSLPQPFAFDGVDNDGDGRVDLADPKEIFLASWHPTKAARLTELEKAFRHTIPEPRIIYYKQPTGLALRGEKPLEAIQLWFYYVVDVGTGSHEGDSEHAFIFLNNAVSVSRDKQREVAARAVRAVVGAGHTDDTANNILATGSIQSPTGVMPASLPRHMPLLVELGKHATAPDLTMDGRFNRGIDSNVFRQASWGSRDGFGFDVLEFLGGYREVYSLPRNVRDVILEREALTDEYRADYEKEFPHYFSDTDQFKDNRKYRFFPLEDLRGVFEILQGAKGENDEASRQKLERHLKAHAACFWPSSAQPTSFALDQQGFAAFLRWLDTGNSHVRIWEKRDFESPEDIFKTYLYPRIELGLTTMWTQDQPEGQLLGASVRVAEFSIGNHPLLNDSSLEVYADVQTKPAALYDFGLTYRYFRGGFGGPYFGIGWRGEDRRGTADLSAGELEVLTRSFGEAAATVPDRYERHTGIDLGYAISWNMGRLPKARAFRHVTLGAMVGLRSELFAENLSPVEEAMNPDLPRRTRFQAKFTVHVGILGPRHPLQR